jgi:hypothetical protein
MLAIAARDCGVESFIFVDGLIQDRPQQVTARIETYTKRKKDREAMPDLGKEEGSLEAAFERFEGVVDDLFRHFVFRKRTVLYIELGKTFLTSRQTLLYTLYDKAREINTTGVVALGSENFTFFELLDKRVRSRFSSEMFFFGDSDSSIDQFLAAILSGAPFHSKRHAVVLGKVFQSRYFLTQASLVYELTASYSKVLQFARIFLHRVRTDLRLGGDQGQLEDPKVFEGLIQDAVDDLMNDPIFPILESMPKLQKDVLQAIQRKAKIKDFDGKLKVHDVVGEVGALEGSILGAASTFRFHAENVLSVLRVFQETRLIRATKLPLSFYGSFEYLGPIDSAF